MGEALSGIRVLDFGRFAAGPVCGKLLAHLGAEVIRVERPGGEEDRYWGIVAPSGDNYLFIDRNYNKKVITLNTKKEKAREIMYRLIKMVDVLIENYSPDAAKAAGITYEAIKKVNPAIVHGHITAFGSSGPYYQRIGFDTIARAMSGSMAISGPPGIPMHEQVPWVDYGTAYLATVGIIAALYQRKSTGEGQVVDISLLHTAVSAMAPFLSEFETGGVIRKQSGNQHAFMGPVNVYKTRDGRWVVLNLLTNAIWRRFCRSISREDLASDPRFDSDLHRWEHLDILDPVIKNWVSLQTVDEITAAAEKIPIPYGICYEQTEVARDPQICAQEMLIKVFSPDLSNRIMVGSPPLKMSESRINVKQSYPAVGQHNKEIYCGMLGYSHQELIDFEKEGII